MAPETSFDGEKAYKHLTKLAVDIGSRNSGSENERKAAKYLEQEFKKLGLKTELQAFKVQTGTVTEQSLELIELTPVSIECKALPLAGPTPKGGVEGELVVVESVVEEYVSSKIAGKIVITTGYYRKGIDLLAKYRPLGVINIGRPGRDVLGHGWGISALREKYGQYQRSTSGTRTD